MQRTISIWTGLIGVLSCGYFGNHLLAEGATYWPLAGFLLGGLIVGATFGKLQAACATPIAV